MSMCESILTIALVCTVKYLHYCDYYYTLGNDSQSTPKLIAYFFCVNLLTYLKYTGSFLTFFLTIFQLTKKERKAPLYGNLPPSLYSLHY